MLNDPAIVYRQATSADVPAMAKVRATEWGTDETWRERITGYMDGKLHPQNALKPRIMFVAEHRSDVVGFIAGHLTQRFDCDGELEWINVAQDYRRLGIAEALVGLLAKWFVENNAKRICIDPDGAARPFYMGLGATALNNHWLVWEDISTLLK